MTAQTDHYAVNQRISKVLETLLLHSAEGRAEVARVLGCSLKTLGRRMRGEYDWTAYEISVLAHHFELPEQVFLDGPKALFQVTWRDRGATNPASAGDRRPVWNAA